MRTPRIAKSEPRRASRDRRVLAGLMAALLAAAVLVPEARSNRLKIAATIFPLYDIARQVAGHVADVVLVLPPGASPHTFEPTPAGVRALAGAEVLFIIGQGLDDWAARLAHGAGVSRLVPADAGVELRRTDGAAHGRVDPHYWLSAPNAKMIARTVGAELAGLAPHRHAEIERALFAYLARLDAADVEVRRRLAHLSTRRTVLDPLGGLPGREGYVELLLFNARAVAAASLGHVP